MRIDSRAAREWSFGQVMWEWLYGEGGYYHRAHIGREGDFYTAVSASRLFGGAIARHILSLLESSALSLPLCIVEVGAHHGELMADVHSFLSALSCGVMEETRFVIVEPLDSVRLRGLAQLAKRGLAEEVEYVRSFSEAALAGGESVFLLGNELFDAFACELVRPRRAGEGGGIEVLYARGLGESIQEARASLELGWRDIGSIAREKAREIERFLSHYQPAGFELPLAWEGFVRELCGFAARAKGWRFLFFDYALFGSGGISLRGFMQHRVLDFGEILRDVAGLFAEIDLTYNVDFDLLARIFAEHGAREIFRGRFGALLVEFGVGELLEILLESDKKQYALESTRLRGLLGGTMGEKFMGVCFGA